MADEVEVESTEEDSSVIRELRTKLKARDKDLKDSAKASHELAQLKATQRQNALSNILSDLNAPAGLSKVYPEDAEVEEEAVKAWLVEDIGIDPDAATPTNAWEAYDKAQGEARPVSPARPEGEEMLERANKGMVHAFTNRYFQPTDTERQDADEIDRFQKDLNKRTEGLIRAGKYPKPEFRGYGGLLNPPAWADLTRKD